jgi:hypothetical protein
MFGPVKFGLLTFRLGYGRKAILLINLTPVELFPQERKNGITLRNNTGEVRPILKEKRVDSAMGDSNDIHHLGQLGLGNIPFVGKFVAEVDNVPARKAFLGGIRPHGQEVGAQCVEIRNLGARRDGGAGNVPDNGAVEKRLYDATPPFVGGGYEGFRRGDGADGADTGVIV